LTSYLSRLSDFWDILYIDTQNIIEQGTNEYWCLESCRWVKGNSTTDISCV